MSAANGTRARGTVIKIPDAGPGLLVVNGEQKMFTLERVWQSPVAPTANMQVEVDFDEAGSIRGLVAVDSQQLAKERLTQLGGVAQERGKEAAELARQGVGALAARMGKVALAATVVIWIAWFFLPGVTLTLGFLGSKSYTFWEFLAVDLSNPLTMGGAGSHGLAGLLGILAIAAPFAAPFVRHPRAGLLNALPLAYVVLVMLKVLVDIARMGGDESSAILDLLSLGVGTYLILAAGLVLAIPALKKRAA